MLKKRRDEAFLQSLQNGKQRRITSGIANSGSGAFPLFGITSRNGQVPGIPAPAQYNFSKIGRGSSITIGSSSSVNSNNESSMSNSNNSATLVYGRRWQIEEAKTGGSN